VLDTATFDMLVFLFVNFTLFLLVLPVMILHLTLFEGIQIDERILGKHQQSLRTCCLHPHSIQPRSLWSKWLARKSAAAQTTKSYIISFCFAYTGYKTSSHIFAL